MVPATFTVPSFEAVCQLYDAFFRAMEAVIRRCPSCGRNREIQGVRSRALQWAVDRIDRIPLIRLRCRACHCVETVFPPWILPYELAALWLLETAVTAVAVDGQSLQRTAHWGHWSPAWVRAHVRPWVTCGAEFRSLVLQWSTRLGWAELVAVDWRPPLGVRYADWAWLHVAWQGLALEWLSVSGAERAGGWVSWRTLAPEVLPAHRIPAVTHLGRRLRALDRFPP
jgi:hypothetical protein